MSMFGNDYNNNSNSFSGTQIGGGGFMNNNNENFNSSNKPRTNNRAIIPYDQRKLSQVTIKQIKTAPPPQPEQVGVYVDNVEISQVSIVAQIQSVDIQSSHTTLTINDFSGSLQAKKWTNDDQQGMKQNDDSSNLTEGKWVRIVGRINHYNGRCSINVFEIIPITNFNEITHHFLECVYAHLENTVGHLQKKEEQKSTTTMNNNHNNNFNNNNNMNNMNNNNNMSMNMNMNMNMNNNLTKIENMVLNIIKCPEYENSDAGCNVERIFEKLPNEDVNGIRSAIDSLSDAGYIYSTVDDDHYKYSGDQQ